MTTCEIAAHLEEIFGAGLSPTLVSAIIDDERKSRWDTVSDEVKAWQSRPLEVMYPHVYLYCLMVKTREVGAVANRAIYMAIDVNLEGQKEVLGVWFAATEGAEFWLSGVIELNNRGVRDILIASVDGLKGFPEAIVNRGVKMYQIAR